MYRSCGHGACACGARPQQERDVADEKRTDDQDVSAAGKQPRQDESNDRGNSEWLRDQVGEDHNLSGSSTYRTLPDQPEGDQPDQDPGDAPSGDRPSNR